MYNTRSKDLPSKSNLQSTSTPTKKTTSNNKSTPITSCPSPLSSSGYIDYDLVEDVKKTRANIFWFELFKFPRQKKTLIKALQGPSSKKGRGNDIIGGENKDLGMSIQIINFGKSRGKKPSIVNIALFGKKSNSNTHPFLLTLEICNKNVHNCLVNSIASSNVMPDSMCKTLNAKPQKCDMPIVQLDRWNVKVYGELKAVSIWLASNPKIFQTIDIIVVDILEAYKLILSRDS